MHVDSTSSLADLLPVLASLLAEVPLDAPVAVGVTLHDGAPGGREIECHFRHLDCTDVVCALGGFVAPASWHAFGIVAPGRAAPEPPTVDGPPADGPHGPGVIVSSGPGEVVACAIVDRSGLVVSEVRDLAGRLLAAGAVEGRMVDVCLRVLGLPTTPPLADPRMWAAITWVDHVLAAVLDADLGEPPPWAALAALDPAGPPGAPSGARSWPRASWAELRTACAAGAVEVCGVSPEHAAWMDDGMFSREAVGALPPLLELLTDLRELLAPSVFERVVERVCHRLDA